MADKAGRISKKRERKQDSIDKTVLKKYSRGRRNYFDLGRISKKPERKEESIDKTVLKKYSRGRRNDFDNLKDKRLQRKLKVYESQHNEAAVQAAKSELLLTDQTGFLEAEGLEKTYHFKQRDIANAVDIASASKYFELKLDKFGPYRLSYTRNGRFLLIGGKKGHLATIDWKSKQLGCEIHVRETVRDVKWLHIETMFAVAQKKSVFIYDSQGVELHCLKKHHEPNRLEFLPYHFLLASVGKHGFLVYQDISTGREVADLFTRLGRCDCMAQNPHNAIINLGHHNGTVTMWAPSMKDPLVKMLCHRGPVRAIAVDNKGLYMATAGLDGQMKIWDVRTYKQLQSYYTPSPASCLSISQRGLLAAGHGPLVEVWRDAFTEKQKKPYMKHWFPSCSVDAMQFCPFEDVLGVGHSKGFGSLLIPGAGEPNFDALEANPYQAKKQRQEFEVKALLEKIQPELISLNPMDIVHVTTMPKKDDDDDEVKEKFQPRNKAKGRGSSRKLYLRKKGVEEQRKMEGIKELIKEKQKEKRESEINEHRGIKTVSALDRFQPRKK
ncbi:uncharacterized protein LOC141875735 [Acropora palmata]|uniref:uncharacterized protein LOC141875735 n=1 Tax=Acropora palmata TaxID=6131 RepID=UPI003DA1626D